jgi:hypothetical protein
MKVLFMAVAITALSAGQPASGEVAGAWTAEFEGRTFIRLDIKTVNGAIAGAVDLRFILNDDDRKELAANGVPVPKPIRLTMQR